MTSPNTAAHETASPHNQRWPDGEGRYAQPSTSGRSPAVYCADTSEHLTTTTNEFAELKAIIKQQGLLDKQNSYYAFVILRTLAMLIVSLVFLAVVDTVPLQFLNAAFLAFVGTQIAFIAHDAGHHQILRPSWKNVVFELILGNLLLGLSRGWWIDKHNRHHANPNHTDLDPDIDFPILAFSCEQACEKRGILRAVVKYQAYFFFPVLLLEAFNMRVHSVRFLLQRTSRYQAAEWFLLVFHFLAYCGGLVVVLGVWHAFAFMLVHQALLGLYLGVVFAPNHKGMPVIDEHTPFDYLRRQVLTSRNLTAHPITDFIFGPLGCQIEHHLFPSMPRNRQRAAAAIVKVFCQQRSIPYHETSVWQSYREILQHFHEVSAPLRNNPRGR